MQSLFMELHTLKTLKSVANCALEESKSVYEIICDTCMRKYYCQSINNNKIHAHFYSSASYAAICLFFDICLKKFVPLVLKISFLVFLLFFLRRFYHLIIYYL